MPKDRAEVMLFLYTHSDMSGFFDAWDVRSRHSAF